MNSAAPSGDAPKSTTRLHTQQVSAETPAAHRQDTPALSVWRDRLAAGWREYFLEPIFRKKQPAYSKDGRHIPLRIGREAYLIDERTGRAYISNSIRSSRYTVWDFLPKQLLFQCTRLNNVYFIAIGIPQAIPGISTTGNYTTILPLLFFILLTIAKEGYDDFRRHRLDKVENRCLASVLGSKHAGRSTKGVWRLLREALSSHLCWGQVGRETPDVIHDGESSSDLKWTQVMWEDIKVGDIVRLKRNDSVPADIALLYASNENGIAYVETAALDGETNLKVRQATPDFHNCNTIEGIQATRAEFSVEDPNRNLYDFNGRVTISGDKKTVPLTLNEVVYRGSVIRNTGLVTGMVINTGEQCKIRMNANHNPKAKKPRLEWANNKIVLTLIVYVVVLSAGLSIGYRIWHQDYEVSAFYLNHPRYSAFVSYRDIIIGYLIMFNNVIPLAMYISLEIVKVGQMLVVQGDDQMYDEASNTPMICNTNTILENLGQVSYIFSDKTGTLTDNVMRFRKMSIGGIAFSHEDQCELESHEICDATAACRHPRQFPSSQLAEHLRQQPDSSFAQKAQRFILGMALCHTALPGSDDDAQPTFEAPSPDEVALVQAAHELGFTLAARSSRALTLLQSDSAGQRTEYQYDILDVIEFSSKRKRMSIILRCPDGRIWLCCKGADTLIMPRLRQAALATRKSLDVRRSMHLDRQARRRSEHLEARNSFSARVSMALSARSSMHVQPRPISELYAAKVDRVQLDDALDDTETLDDASIFSRCFQQVDSFATEGFRTLLYAERTMSESEYEAWKRQYQEATTSLENRQEKIEAAGELVEQDLHLLGASAIEDKLQKGVPETVEKLGRANIKICMLTGDKRETAINIAHAAGICKPLSEIVILDASKGDLAEQLRQMSIDVREDPLHRVAVIDGQSLAIVEEQSELKELFYPLVARLDSVICCRASPSQKADLVRALRRQMPTTLTLAIGDGSNDIAMITASHVGVGISGKEGLQAARVADYSIAQFRFLQRLLLVHGRWNYIRTAKFILWTFFKEFFFYMMQALYQRYNGYTGSSLYESWSLTVLNTLFTSLCVIVPGVLEQDLQPITLLSVPELYVYGQRDWGLNLWKYTRWMVVAAAEGIFVWFVAWAAWGHFNYSSDNGAFALGNLCFSIGIAWQNIKLLLLETHYKTLIVYGAFLITFGGWWAWQGLLSAVYSSNLTPFDVKGGFGADGYGADPVWWATFWLILVFLIVLEVTYRTVERYVLRCVLVSSGVLEWRNDVSSAPEDTEELHIRKHSRGDSRSTIGKLAPPVGTRAWSLLRMWLRKKKRKWMEQWEWDVGIWQQIEAEARKREAVAVPDSFEMQSYDLERRTTDASA